MTKLNFISDPGHGWLEVPLAIFRESQAKGMAASKYSYKSKIKQCVYLEEDCDAPKFLAIMGEDNFEVKCINVEKTNIRDMERL
jgi:hypothetical protein